MICLTKADKVKDAMIETKLKETADYIRGAGSICNPTIHAVSAHSGYGIKELLSHLVYCNDMELLSKPAGMK